MKKLLIASVLISAFTLANAAETSSFRVNGDIVSVGDSVGVLFQRAGKPKSSYTYQVDTGRNTTVTATDFYYEIGNEIYTVTVREGKVFNISWERR
jgi:hypothetical protein